MGISKNKTGVLINMNKELKEKLEELALKDKRSLTAYINIILEKHVNEIKNNN